MGNDPKLFHDRIAVRELGERNVALLNVLREQQIGRVDRKQKVHFCGMIRKETGEVSVFLPHGAEATIASARLTMSVLARYGKDMPDRKFNRDDEVGNSGMLSVIKRLADDFLQNGVFAEPQRIRTRNSGKPNWKRTVTREQAFQLDGTGEVYTDIATSRTVKSNETLLARIQAHVLTEIIDEHGWWLDGIHSRRSDFRRALPLNQRRSRLPALLDSLLPRLYSSRSLFLAKYLGHYLRETRGSTEGTQVFGVEDFHTIWEAMLKSTLINVDSSWNEKLPKAVYRSMAGGDAVAPERSMLTDIVVRNGNALIVIDAKYYRAVSGGTVPGWPDIAKQMFYELAVRSVVGASFSIRNCFAFPAREDSGGPFNNIAMLSRVDGELVPGFPSIECHYFDVGKVMLAYAKHRVELEFPENIEFPL